jgi:hypothetical protein
VDSLNNKAVFATPGSGCVTTGIETHSMNNYTVSCFPNPVSENLTLTMEGKAKEIMIYDILGNVVYKANDPLSVTKINTELFNNGIYFIKVIFDNNTVVTKKISVI